MASVKSESQNDLHIANPNAFSGLQNFAIEQLKRAQREIRRAREPCISTYRIEPQHFDRSAQAWKDLRAAVAAGVVEGTSTVYYVKQIGSGPEAQKLIQKMFHAGRQGRDGRSRDNKCCSPVLYVGSSRKMQTRLGEHLGFCSTGTYALKLKDWYRAKEPLKLVCARYPVETSLDAIAELEDALWERLRPMFGRKGAR